jgi:hypothetical protein
MSICKEAGVGKKKELKWGQTPFDELCRDELLRQCQRMFAATQSLTTALGFCKINAPGSPYWGTKGTGGTALEKGKQALEAAVRGYNGENIYCSFFRYANDLLFTEQTGFEIGFGWDVCPKCGQMVGRGAPGKRHTGMACKDVLHWGECDGIMRPLEWNDLKPPLTPALSHEGERGKEKI